MNGYPRLYIGKVGIELKKRITFPIYQLNKDSLPDFIAYYSTIKSMNNPLVVEDVTYLSVEEQSKLLKFIEESNLKIILIASQDNIIPTLLSRMSLVYKIKENIKSLFQPYKQGKEELEGLDPDMDHLTYLNKQLNISPISYYYDNIVIGKPNKQKLLNLITD